MEIIAGSAIEKISGPIFAVPILFCCSKFTLLRQTNRVRFLRSSDRHRGHHVYNLMIFADSLVESLFPALVFGIYCKWATRKAAIVSISAGAIVICLTFFVRISVWWS